MNPDFDDQLETEIDRQLKDLPELVAPSTLIPRTLRRIAQPATRQSRSWATWPAGVRAAYLAIAFAALAGTVPGLQAVNKWLVAPMAQRFAHWQAGLDWLWHSASALGGAAALLLNHIDRGLVVAGALAVVTAYAACVGFGTAFFRLTFADSRKR